MDINNFRSQRNREFIKDSTLFPKSPPPVQVRVQDRKLAKRGVVRKQLLSDRSEDQRPISKINIKSLEKNNFEVLKRKLFETDQVGSNGFESQKKFHFSPRASSTPNNTPVTGSPLKIQDFSPIPMVQVQGQQNSFDDSDSFTSDSNSTSVLLNGSTDSTTEISGEGTYEFNNAFMGQSALYESQSQTIPVPDKLELTQPMSFVDYFNGRATNTNVLSFSEDQETMDENEQDLDFSGSPIPLQMSFRELGLGSTSLKGLGYQVGDFRKDVALRNSKSTTKSPNRLAALNLEKQWLSPNGQDILEGKYIRRRSSIDEFCGYLENLRMNSF